MVKKICEEAISRIKFEILQNVSLSNLKIHNKKYEDVKRVAEILLRIQALFSETIYFYRSMYGTLSNPIANSLLARYVSFSFLLTRYS